jgi:hypothetical protein
MHTAAADCRNFFVQYESSRQEVLATRRSQAAASDCDLRASSLSLYLPLFSLWTGDWGLGAAWQASAARERTPCPFSAEADMRWDWLEESVSDDESEGKGIALISAGALSQPLVQLEGDRGADVPNLLSLELSDRRKDQDVDSAILRGSDWPGSMSSANVCRRESVKRDCALLFTRLYVMIPAGRAGRRVGEGRASGLPTEPAA